MPHRLWIFTTIITIELLLVAVPVQAQTLLRVATPGRNGPSAKIDDPDSLEYAYKTMRADRDPSFSDRRGDRQRAPQDEL